MSTLTRFIPILQWLPGYGGNHLRGDLAAGVTVGVMLIPQGMAYAMLAGLPPIYGLYAATVPLVLYAIFGTSRQLAVGPVAMVSLLIVSGIGDLAVPGSERYIVLALLLALMVGVIQLVLGLFRLGFLVNFLSHPVISGFTSAAALIIGLNQLKHLTGIELSRSNQIHHILLEMGARLSEIQPATLGLGLAAIFIILILKRWNRAIPGPLVAVVLGIMAVYFLDLHLQGVQIIQEIPVGLPGFSLPSMAINDLQSLVPAASTIALIGFMESFAVAKAIQSKHRDYKIDANQELIGLGLANIGGALFRSFPVTGGFSRTAVNDQAGARSGMASIISAALIMLTLLFLTPLFYYLPRAILASVIMVAVFSLIDFREVIHLWRTDKKDWAMLIVTFLATLFIGIEEGIAIGVLLSLALVLYRTSYPHVAMLGKIPDTRIYRNLDRFEEAQSREDMVIMRFDAQLFFGNAGFFQELLEGFTQDRPNLKMIIVNSEAINYLDSSAVHMLKEVIEELEHQEIRLVFTGVRGPVRDVLHKNGLLAKIGVKSFFNTTAEAVEYFDQNYSEHPHGHYATQSNYKPENP